MTKEYVIGKDEKGNAIVVDPDLEYTKSGVMIAGLSGVLLGGVATALYLGRKMTGAISTLNSFKESAEGLAATLRKEIENALAATQVTFSDGIRNALSQEVTKLKGELALSFGVLSSSFLTAEDVGEVFDNKIKPILQSIHDLAAQGAGTATVTGDVESLLSAFKSELTTSYSTENERLKTALFEMLQASASNDELTQVLAQLSVLQGLVTQVKPSQTIQQIYNDLFDRLNKPSDSAIFGAYHRPSMEISSLISFGETKRELRLVAGDELVCFGGRLFFVQRREGTGARLKVHLVDFDYAGGFDSVVFVNSEGTTLDNITLVLKNESLARDKLVLDNAVMANHLLLNETGIDGSTHFTPVIYSREAFYNTCINSAIDKLRPVHNFEDYVQPKSNDVRTGLFIRSLGTPDSVKPGNGFTLYKRNIAIAGNGVTGRDIIASALHRSMRDHSFAWVVSVL